MFETFKFLAKTYFFPEVPIPLDMPHYFKGQCFNHNNRNRHAVSRTRAQTWSQTSGSVCLLPHTDHWYFEPENAAVHSQLNEQLFFWTLNFESPGNRHFRQYLELKIFYMHAFFSPDTANTPKILQEGQNMWQTYRKKNLTSKLRERSSLFN